MKYRSGITLAFGIMTISAVSTYWALEHKKVRELALQVILVNDQRQAEEILQKLKEGESFEQLARKHSKDPSAAAGGNVGITTLEALRPEVRGALKGVRPGQVTDVFKTPYGYMVVKVLFEPKQAQLGGMGAISRNAQAVEDNSQYTTDVSGSYEAVQLFRRYHKVVYEQDLQANCDARLRAIPLGMRHLNEFLAYMKARDAQAIDSNVLSSHELLGQLWSYRGDTAEAIQQFQLAHDIAVACGSNELQLELEKKLGVTELHGGMTNNCANPHHAQSCIFPLPSEAWHAPQTGSEKAVRHFLTYLNQRPDDLEVRWLLNLAYMTLGKYPQAVPKIYLISPSVFVSKEDIGRFVDIAPALGLDIFNMAGGVIVDDFDNDGYLDIVISSFDSCSSLRYFHNNGDGTFIDRTAQADLSNQLGGLSIVQTDYNNDGWLDIYVPRGAWEVPVRSSLLQNNRDGTFIDVTRKAGLAGRPSKTQAVAWADFDNDGYLDLFVGNEFTPSQLFHNNGDGTFMDIANAAGLDRTAFTKGAVAGDYDDDGYLDIYVSNLGSANFLYHNNRNGTFSDVAQQLNVHEPINSFPLWFFDYNNDGGLDLFVSTFTYSLTEVLRSYLGLPVRQETLRLYRNRGGVFEQVSHDVGLDRVFMPMGANFGDVDNDGYLDFYLGTGGPSYASLVPNVLFRNHEGIYFVDITASSGTGHLQKGHGIAFADINNSGDQHILSELGGAAPGDRCYTALYVNPGNHGNNWITVKLQGVKTNRAAIGARIKLTLQDDEHSRRFIYRWVSTGGSFGASPLQQHIGIGKATQVETLEVWWPTSNTHQVFHNIPPNQFIEIREFEEDYTNLKRRAFTLPSL